MTTAHPTLYEKLLPAYRSGDYSAVLRIIKDITPNHLNKSEKTQLAFELPKFRQYMDFSQVIKESIERLMGIRPPRHNKDFALYTYTNPYTAKLEELAITEVLSRLQGTALGQKLYVLEKTKRHKPKKLLADIQSSPFRHIAQKVAPMIAKPMTGGEAELLLVREFAETITQELVSTPESSLERASHITTPTFIFATVDAKQAARIEYFKSLSSA